MKKIIQSGILLLLLKLPVSSQIDEISWDFEPGFNYYAPTIFNSSSLNFKIPDQLKYYWDENGSTSLRDVPGFHGTTFFFLKNKVKINEKLWLESDLYVEQLGASFDLFNRDIVNVFPLVTFNFEKNIALFSDTVKSKIKYGVLKNHQEYNKLTVYGYDIQGFDFKASYKSVRFSLTHISELSFHNLEDPIHSRVYFSKKHLKTTFELGIGGHVEPFYNTFDQHKYKGLDIGLTISRDSSSFRVYAQYSSNSFEGFNFLDNLKNNYAAIVGIKGGLTTKKLDIKHFLEGRVYTYLFNAERLASANTIHPQYYFQRDMLTWSRFIELHSTSYPSDIIGLNYNFNGNLNIYKGASIYLKSELSLFQGKKISTAFYPFYNIGYQYKIRNNKLELGISNKIFVDYLATPNFALMKTPFFNLVMIRKLDKW